MGKNKVPKNVENSGKRGENLSSNKFSAAKIGSRGKFQKLPSPAELGFSTAHFQEWEDCQDNRFVPASFLKGQAGYQKFLSQLSEEQAIALNAYTGEDHFRFTNSFWRASQTERKELVAQHPQEVERAILIERYLSQAIRDNSNGTDKIVYRGVTGDFARQAALTPIGATMKFASFTSVSSELGTTIDFVDSQEFRRDAELSDVANAMMPELENHSGEREDDTKITASVQFEMRTEKGMFLSGEESEHILPLNTNWVVVGKRLANIGGTVGDKTERSLFVQLIDADLLEKLR